MKIEKIPDMDSTSEDLAWNYYPDTSLITYSRGAYHHEIKDETLKLFPGQITSSSSFIRGIFTGTDVEVYSPEEKFPIEIRLALEPILTQIARREGHPDDFSITCH